MAIARLSMKVGKAGKASPHADYIARTGQYAKRLERGEKLEASEAGNMPAWAQSNPSAFWQAADANERANGTTYREMEVALPRELSPDQRLELVRDWVAQEIGDKHAYQFAIHTPTASDGAEQPHAHIMFSERQIDGIERDPEQYFKRYNSKNPERGGAKKGYGENAGKTLTRAERTADLKALRGRWEDHTNNALEMAGSSERIDMRSYAEQGNGLAPEKKQLPSEWRDPKQRAEVLQFREAKQHQKAIQKELSQLVPDAKSEIVSLEHERTLRQAAAAAVNKVMDAGRDVAAMAKEWKDSIATGRKNRLDRAHKLEGINRQKAEAIATDRAAKRRAYAKQRPEQPSGLLAGFKRKAYDSAMGLWERGMKSIEDWRKPREDTLRNRADLMMRYSSIKAEIATEKRMKRERPDDYESIQKYEQEVKQQRAQERQQKIREQLSPDRSRNRDRGGHGY